MIWPFKRRKALPSREALQSITDGERELEVARRLRRESEQVGHALATAHNENHIAAGLIASIQRGKPA